MMTKLKQYMIEKYPENMQGDCIYDDLYRILAVIFTEDQFKYHSYLAPDIPVRLLTKEEILEELNKIGVFKLMLQIPEGHNAFDILIDFFEENEK
jgi:hypothetical protein